MRVGGVIETQRIGAMAAVTERAATTSSWATLYRLAAVAAGVAVLLVPIQIVVFALYPFPDTASGWFSLLQNNPLAGLVDLDLLLVVDNVLLVAIALAIYAALRRINLSASTLAVGMWLVSLVLLITANPAIQMLDLSHQYAVAGSGADRTAALAAGQALLATWQGTAFQVSYVIGALATITIGWVMLHSPSFSRPTGYAFLIGNLLSLGLYMPTVGLAISAFSGIVLWVWFGLVARDFLRLGRSA